MLNFFNNLYYLLSDKNKKFIKFIEQENDFQIEKKIIPEEIRNIKYKVFNNKDDFLYLKISTKNYEVFIRPKQKNSDFYFFFRMKPYFFIFKNSVHNILDIDKNGVYFKKLLDTNTPDLVPLGVVIIKYPLKNFNYVYNLPLNENVINDIYRTILKIFYCKNKTYLELKKDLLEYCEFYFMQNDINISKDETVKNFIYLHEHMLKFLDVKYKKDKIQRSLF